MKIPLRRNGRPYTYDWPKLRKKGQLFIPVSPELCSSVRNSALSYAKRHGIEVATRSEYANNGGFKGLMVYVLTSESK